MVEHFVDVAARDERIGASAIRALLASEQGECGSDFVSTKLGEVVRERGAEVDGSVLWSVVRIAQEQPAVRLELSDQTECFVAVGGLLSGKATLSCIQRRTKSPGVEESRELLCLVLWRLLYC